MYEVLAGLHMWLRQLDLHCGFYRFWAEQRKTCGDGHGGDAALARSLSSAVLPASGGPALSDSDAIKAAILKCDKFLHAEAYDTGTMRVWILGKFRKSEHLAEKCKDAAVELMADGLLESAADLTRAKRGRRVVAYKKATWDTISKCETAVAEATRLGLSRGHFP